VGAFGNRRDFRLIISWFWRAATLLTIERPPDLGDPWNS
jgi:hypothetical protein